MPSWDDPNDPTNPFAGPSVEDMIAQIANAQYGNVPGKTPASQLNYVQDWISSLGFDPFQMASAQSEVDQPAPWVAPVNTTRVTYGNNPLYSAIFDKIDQEGLDPVSAVNAVKAAFPSDKASGLDWEDKAQVQELKAIAKSYATENAKAVAAEQAYNVKNANKSTDYHKADGSKWKNSPIGGPNVNSSALEYDLLGDPTVEDLLQTYAGNRYKETQGSIHDRGAWMKQDLLGTLGGMGTGSNMAGAKGSSWHYADKALDDKMTNKGKRKPAPEAKKLIGGNSNEQIGWERAARDRINLAKSTSVASDANNNARAKILALIALTGR